MINTTSLKTRNAGRVTKRTYVPKTRSQTARSSTLAKAFSSISLTAKQNKQSGINCDQEMLIDEDTVASNSSEVEDDGDVNPMSEDEQLNDSILPESRYIYRNSDCDSHDESENEMDLQVANLPVMRSILPNIGTQSSIATVEQVTPVVNCPSKKSRKSYGKNWTEKQIQTVLNSIRVYGMTHGAAARSVGTSWSNVTKIINEHKSTGNAFPKPKTRTTQGKINSQGAEHIKMFIKKHNTATLQQIQESFEKKFSVTISQSNLHRHLTQKCHLSLNKQIDYESNCIFIDECPFNASMRRNYGWSERGRPVHIKVKTRRSPTITLLAAVCNDGLVEVSLRIPQKADKKRRAKVKRSQTTKEKEDEEKNGEQEMKKTKGTNSHDFLAFLHLVMDRLEEQGRTGCYLVIDNAPIYVAWWIKDEIKILYKNALIDIEDDTEDDNQEGTETEKLQKQLEDRISAAIAKVTPSDFKGWVFHSISFFPRCIAHEDAL
ncbi:hypothetical protein INT45_007368 [Circinella minor]|uniref:Tc1-like transposase DDE domain-containing protein n=1 Tax=Circinella minor TaxID=1195481 RepID=A0A8H7VC78_9FUNG|nr:hypothetical protein INT45_007368 [Circinella minor]